MYYSLIYLRESLTNHFEQGAKSNKLVFILFIVLVAKACRFGLFVFKEVIHASTAILKGVSGAVVFIISHHPEDFILHEIACLHHVRNMNALHPLKPFVV